MEHRIVKNDEGVSPVIAVILMVAITVVLAAVLYVWAASFLEQGESAPIATFFVQEGSDGIYHVDVIKVSKQEDLAGFSFYLKDETGSTYVGGGHGFGEIAMQIVGGEEHGIDMAYGGDDEQLQNRAGNVSDDDGSEYPVSFNDNDRDGKLSAGDQFMVYGNGNAANGPAADNWRLDIQFDASGDIIGSAKML
ncbi:MAG: type IV pilin N-terminal domain-containing protein [Candidatus Poseidoniia archaeon]|nr:type IV pilin N-terminal domain-containing protein [Candidatus Poseidoniia archaeon]